MCKCTPEIRTPYCGQFGCTAWEALADSSAGSMRDRARTANLKKLEPSLASIRSAADAGKFEIQLWFKTDAERNEIGTQLGANGYTLQMLRDEWDREPGNSYGLVVSW